MQKAALRTAGVIFALVAALHFVRAFWCVAVYFGNTIIPVYVSWIGGPVCVLLAAWMFVASKK